ncbi:hypothetical protein [Bradyrhizobium sp. CCBAU 11357]|uniref:hypothetical protein n=1 Tax=Bradyrhizobium sp. CCBAU 11357 TaxID=1630808 RepID=UPI002304001D|nr:hypothetical protein [Bradyrhizobium sp. CCBAU 11357]MDA9500527.1 hypothetical protein [Bradyrhizobium sp. CCBAU 11357]
MENVEQFVRANKTRAIARVRTYPDTIGVSARRRFPVKLLHEIKANCGKMIPRLRRDDHDPETTWRYVLIMHQPSRWALKRLHRYKCEEDESLNICKLHIARDFEPCEGYSREDVLKFVHESRRLKYERTDARPYEFFETTYSNARGHADDQTKPSKIDVIYSDKPSKLDGTPDAIHTETRINAGREVKTTGMNDCLDVTLLNPAQDFTAQYAVKKHHGMAEKIVCRIIRKTQASYMDLCPAIVERRVRGLYRRLGIDRLSEFRRMFPHQYRRLNPWDVLEFDDLEYAKGDKNCA